MSLVTDRLNLQSGNLELCNTEQVVGRIYPDFRSGTTLYSLSDDVYIYSKTFSTGPLPSGNGHILFDVGTIRWVIRWSGVIYWKENGVTSGGTPLNWSSGPDQVIGACQLDGQLDSKGNGNWKCGVYYQGDCSWVSDVLFTIWYCKKWED